MPMEPTTPTTPATPPAAPPVVQQTLPLQQPDTVTIPMSQLQALTAAQTELIRVQEAQRHAEIEHQRREAELKTRTGEIEKGLAELRATSEAKDNDWKGKLTLAEQRAQNFAVERELATALAGQPVIPAAVPQLMTLLRPSLQAQPDGNTITVRTATMQDAVSFVREQLARPEFAHFVRAENQGGTAGGSGGHLSPPTQPANLPQQTEWTPPNMGLAIVADAIAAQAAAREEAKKVGALHPTLVPMATQHGVGFAGFGLKPQKTG